MESRKLEIILHSAKGLFDVKSFGTMDPYVAVWIAGDGKESKRRTKVAKKGATNPVWNCRMEFNRVSMESEYSLVCEIKHDGKLSDRRIGEVQVSFAKLLAGDASGNRVSYPVSTPTGEVKGEIIISHKFSESDKKDGSSSCSGSGTGTPCKKKDGIVKHIAKKVATEVASDIARVSATTMLIATANSLMDDEDEYEHKNEDDDVYENEEYEDEDGEGYEEDYEI